MKAVALLLAVLIVSSSASSAPTPAPLRNGFGDFFVGIFLGFQPDPNQESLCVLELKSVVSDAGLLFTYVGEIFSNYVNVFRSLNQFAEFMDDFDESVKSCEFSRLVEQIEALRDFSGRSAVLARVAIKSNYLVQAWKTFYNSLMDGAGEAMGVAIGNILSVVLNFSI